MRQNEHVSFIFWRKLTVLLFRGSELFLSLKRKLLGSFGRKDLDHSPSMVPRKSLAGTGVSVKSANVITVLRSGLFEEARLL
jgi:hypothetical protein